MSTSSSDLRFEATLYVYRDGTCVVTGDTIRGLVIEADTFDQMHSELCRLVPLLLRSNHGLTDEDISRSILGMTMRKVPEEDVSESLAHATQPPMIQWQDRLQDSWLVAA